jgi:hypothetical protein
MTVFEILLYAEFLSIFHYSPQHKKYITICVLISTVYSLIFHILTKCIFPHGSKALVDLDLLYGVPLS